MTKIAITGSNGLVGSRIIELLKKDFTFIPFTQKDFDITDPSQTKKLIDKTDFDLMIHLAAYTNVAGAETNREACYKINVDGTRNIFNAVQDKEKKFIFISTDFVFDGKQPPYDEDSSPNPPGIYADSKYQAEKVVKNKAMIVRIAYPYRAFFEPKRDFFRTFKAYLEQNKPLSMISDSLMTPTFIDDIAYGLKYLIKNFTTDTIHLVGGQAISPYQAAVLIAEKFKLDKSLITKTTYGEYIKQKPGLPQFADIRSKKNNFQKMRSLKEGLETIRIQLGQ
ncbi:NAD(P)-dependent oxidoreductase [Patescibacteria group bacterium]|nr:NAD(P)-dependent oxidoreductase [Patescibacteria group bacterium]